MKILYIGDVMGAMGLSVVEKVLPDLRCTENIDLVIAQAENVTNGKGISPADFKRLRKAGVDFCSGGDHSFDQQDIVPLLDDPAQPIIRPANYPEGTDGIGYKYADTSKGKVLVISLLGHVVGRNANLETDNPLRIVDKILKAEQDIPRLATVVNFHGDFSSEKVVVGHYVDGRVTLAVGDHWHVPTADARILPGGTAHQTDVGMCGALDSSLGVTYESIIPRWRDGKMTRNVLETTGRSQFNASLVESDDTTGLATKIQAIQELL